MIKSAQRDEKPLAQSVRALVVFFLVLHGLRLLAPVAEGWGWVCWRRRRWTV